LLDAIAMPMNVAAVSSVVVLAVLAVAPGRAGAQELSAGARIGGYGFRQAPNASSQHTGWTDCRMSGIGLFGQRGVGERLFVEAGLDAYFADTTGTGLHDHGGAGAADEAAMDRVSGLVSAAVGVRLFRQARVSPYLQLGLGIEATRVSLVDAATNMTLEDSFVLPLGFIGLGGDLRLGGVRVGINLRVHAMGHFDHEEGIQKLEPEAELAAQAQFYAKFTL
jgi:hypothetical protein